MAFGPPVCACCGKTEHIEEHHLYLRSDGCPDDLTVWLCNTCHGRAHKMKRRICTATATRNGLVKANAKGRVGGNPKLRAKDPQTIALVSAARRAAYLARVLKAADDWLPIVERMRPKASWEKVAATLNQTAKRPWTDARLIRAVRKLTAAGRADAGLLTPARQKQKQAANFSIAAVAAIRQANPQMSLRALGIELASAGQVTPRGRASWAATSVAHALREAKRQGLLFPDARVPTDMHRDD